MLELKLGANALSLFGIANVYPVPMQIMFTQALYGGLGFGHDYE